MITFLFWFPHSPIWGCRKLLQTHNKLKIASYTETWGEARPRCSSPFANFAAVSKKQILTFLPKTQTNFSRSHHSINFFNYLLPIFVLFRNFLCWFRMFFVVPAKEKKVSPSMFHPLSCAFLSINHSSDFLIISYNERFLEGRAERESLQTQSDEE